jgi:predicted flap endonuclease-1-like 5' DNA nuclease
MHMAEQGIERREVFLSVLWWGAALLGALLVMLLVTRLDGAAAGLVFGGVTFMVLGLVFTFRFMPPPAQVEAELHEPGHGRAHGLIASDMLPHGEPAPAHAAHGHAAGHDHATHDHATHGHAAGPDPVAAREAATPVAPVPVPPVAAMPHAEVIPAPSAADAAFSERVRSAARAAGEAARAAAGEPEPSRLVAETPAVKPSGLSERPADGGDDLKRINGVGPKLEALLHGLGVYHFHQIAAWGPSEVAWVDSNLEGFRGRVIREDWVGQSVILAAGGETEHSRAVDRGEFD